MSNSGENTLYFAHQVRELDHSTIDAGISGFELMRHAGGAAFELIKRLWPEVRGISVVCGSGNNAGDGYVVAALAARAGLEVQLIALREPAALKGEASQAVAMARDEQLVPLAWSEFNRFEGEIIIDALLGTGISGDVQPPYDEAINAINGSVLPVLALDLPSGLDADTGVVLGQAVEAQHTITFIGRKFGLLTGQAPDYTGTLHFAALGVDARVRERVASAGTLLQPERLKQSLPRRKPTTHKGHCGHLLVVGGRPGFGGSTIMTAETAARVGAGLVSLATDPVHIPPALARCPEMMVKAVRNALDLEELLEMADGVAIGPGLGQGAWGEGLLDAVLTAEGPRVVDADGLNLLASNYTSLRRDDWVLTPHPGEAARLLNCSVKDIQADRREAALELQHRRGGVVVLKGAGTLVVGGQAAAQVFVNPYGNPGMASGGMGDVLGGIIASLIVQGLDLLEASASGVLLHGMAADMAAAEGGERGLLATDLACYARRLANP
ncbi:NAD(P)H-hydrate dehydratase [Phytohalomonas tamaricis]|uniref:NAD(P)H-hydrate dehydratase n=1 Tax=Phytohalomonas tamaricis TaxID=2081032 RepID=UPI000D0B67A1|nr:NAD(P)H-hydrate dehydratase [Phytohalomonas tamaricis]